tara:strand:- start:47 stop:1141 length:1095 start_codon:yes stop_codon:yes gene_type:complete
MRNDFGVIEVTMVRRSNVLGPPRLERTLKLIIAGTSNGIFHNGYQASLKKAFPDATVVNRSLGASPADFTVFRIADISISPGDIVVVETMVNDAAALRAGGFSAKRLDEVLRFVMNEIRRNGATPLAIMIPGRVRDQHTAAAQATHMAVYRDLGITIIDGCSWISNKASSLNSDYDEMFEDPAHLKREYARELGETVAEHAAGRFPDSLCRDLDYALVFEPVVIGGNTIPSNPDALVRNQVNTSLMQCETVTFRDQAITLALDNNRSLYGFVVDAMRTSAVVEVSGDKTVAKDLRFDYDSKSNARMIVTPILETVRTQGSRITLTQHASWPGPVERSHYTVKAAQPVPELTLAGYIFKEHSERA